MCGGGGALGKGRGGEKQASAVAGGACHEHVAGVGSRGAREEVFLITLATSFFLTHRGEKANANASGRAAHGPEPKFFPLQLLLAGPASKRCKSDFTPCQGQNTLMIV